MPSRQMAVLEFSPNRHSGPSHFEGPNEIPVHAFPSHQSGRFGQASDLAKLRAADPAEARGGWRHSAGMRNPSKNIQVDLASGPNRFRLPGHAEALRYQPKFAGSPKRGCGAWMASDRLRSIPWVNSRIPGGPQSSSGNGIGPGRSK